MLKIWVAVPSNTGGYCWLASASATLRGKDGGLMRVLIDVCMNRGSGSLLLGKEWWELARDLMEGSLELSVDML